jgi:uncharacterized delta-60 repeat protein
MNSQTVTFNPIPTINCPSGNMNVCGTYSPPASGGPFYVTSTTSIVGNGVIVTSNSEYMTTITGNTFCLTLPTNLLNGSPFGNYEINFNLSFTQINPPFAVFSASTVNGVNPSGVDIFYSDTCPIIANDDNLTINNCIGGNLNVISNDFILGNPATVSNVILTQLTTSPNVVFNASTGVASVPAGTAPGTYNISYQICNPVNTSQCDPAIVSFIVVRPPVVATNDSFSINGCTGGTTTTVLANDTLCGTSFSNPVNVSFVGTVPIAGATISNTGIITIPQGTLPGNHAFNYTVCHLTAPFSCSNTAMVTVVVSNPPLVANNDSYTFSSLTGGFTSSVLTNDSVNGITASSNNVDTAIFSSNPPITNLQISSSGIITIPPGLTAGTYTIVYSITQIGCSSNVAYGSVTITIVANSDGTPDIVPGIRANSIVSLVDTQSDNKIIIVGYFTTYNTISNIGIARLNTDLTLDTTTGFNSTGALPLPDGQFGGNRQVPLDMKVLRSASNLDKILLAGSFTGYSGSFSNGTGIARLFPDGNIDTTFNNEALAAGVTRGVSGSNSQVRTLYVYPENAINGNAGKIIIGGMFDTYNGLPAYKLARLNANGTLDVAFSNNINTIFTPGPNATNGFNSSPQAIAVQFDGRIIVAGYFTSFNGITKNNILRLNNNGTIDTSFNTYTGLNPNIVGTQIQKILIQPDNNIIIAGFFSKYNNVSRNSIARLLSTGALDTTFNPGAGFFPVHVPNTTYGSNPAGMIRSLEFEPAVGATPLKLYVSGNFTQYNSLTVPKVILINCPTTGAGARDSDFRMDTNGSITTGGPNNYVWFMKKQGEKLILSGEFTLYNSNSALRITRIKPKKFPIDGFSNELRDSLLFFYDSEPEIDLLGALDNNFVIFPNPSNGVFSIKSLQTNKKINSISIYNTLGQKIFEKQDFIKEEYSIDLSQFQKGTYFITIGNETKTTRKAIIIQ